MKRIFSLLLLLMSVTAVSAQKVINDPNAEPREVPSFRGLQISHAFDVVLTQGTADAVVVSSNRKEDLPMITTEVEGGVLKIGLKDKGKWWPKDRKLRAYISVRNLERINVSGASNIKLEGRLTASSLKLDFSGASNMKGELVVSGNLDIDLSGASDLELSGSAGTVRIDASGASDIKAYNLTADMCTVDASGACTVNVTVNKELSAELSGASTVNYRGTATIRNIRTSGASNISRKSK